MKLCTVEFDFDTLLGDTVREKLSYLLEKIRELAGWLGEYVGITQNKICLIGTPENLSGLTVATDAKPVSEHCHSVSVEFCKKLEFEPISFLRTRYGIDLFVLAYSDTVPQGEMRLIAEGFMVGEITIKIKNFIF